MARRRMEEAEVEALRESLIDAAERCHGRGGLDKMGMADIAKEAGLARSTVYRYFTNRDELLIALIRRDVEALTVRLMARIAGIEDLADYIVEGLVLSIREVPKRPLLAELFVADRFALSRSKVWTSPEIVILGNEFMRAFIDPARKQGLLRDDIRPEILTEWVYRVLLSFLTLPSRWAQDEDQLREALHKLLIPVLFRS